MSKVNANRRLLLNLFKLSCLLRIYQLYRTCLHFRVTSYTATIFFCRSKLLQGNRKKINKDLSTPSAAVKPHTNHVDDIAEANSKRYNYGRQLTNEGNVIESLAHIHKELGQHAAEAFGNANGHQHGNGHQRRGNVNEMQRRARQHQIGIQNIDALHQQGGQQGQRAVRLAIDGIGLLQLRILEAQKDVRVLGEISV